MQGRESKTVHGGDQTFRNSLKRLGVHDGGVATATAAVEHVTVFDGEATVYGRVLTVETHGGRIHVQDDVTREVTVFEDGTVRIDGDVHGEIAIHSGSVEVGGDIDPRATVRLHGGDLTVEGENRAGTVADYR